MQTNIKLVLFSNPKEIHDLISPPVGISASITPPTMAFDCGIDVDRAYDVVVTVLNNGIVIGVLANYIYDKIAKKPENKAVIGGNTISGNNVTVNQIINILEDSISGNDDKK